MLSLSELEALEYLVAGLAPRLVADRSDFHQFAEVGWTEFRTASRIAHRLCEMGFEVKVGQEALAAEARMGLPSPGELEAHWQRALAQGGDPEFMAGMRGGFTGVVGTLDRGPGPVIGLRFDIDALDLVESRAPSHRPAAEGFASVNEGAAHACGHDGHAAIGMGWRSYWCRSMRWCRAPLSWFSSLLKRECVVPGLWLKPGLSTMSL